MDFSIMPECFADTLMIETFVPPKYRYNHKHSCSQVENEMVRGKLKDKFAVGIIDLDKRGIKYLKEFEVVDSVEGSLILWRHQNKAKHHYIIQIQPAMEEWMLTICKDEGIEMHELPTEVEDLMRITKKQNSLANPKLKAVFTEMSDKNNNISVRKLKGWVLLLKEKNYQIDINELRNV